MTKKGMIMKKIFTLISILMVIGLVSCETNEIKYETTPIDQSRFAQVRLVYDLPLVTSSSLNVAWLIYNGDTVSRVSTPLGSIFPNSAAKYHVLPIGTNSVKLLQVNTRAVTYEGTFDLEAGRWSAFVYNTSEPPIMVQEPEVYQTGDPWADTVCYIRFVNLFHKADGTPMGKLYLKGKRTINNVVTYIDIASANYGEASDYVPYKLYRQGIKVWSGTESALVFTVFDENGAQLQYYKTATTKGAYEATGLSMTKGVNYILHFNGKDGTYTTQAYRLSQFTVN